jgi:L-fuconolactonase
LALAAHPNIAVKISGACTLSHESFPYNDIWNPLFRVFDAFGLNLYSTAARERDGSIGGLG